MLSNFVSSDCAIKSTNATMDNAECQWNQLNNAFPFHMHECERTKYAIA